MEELGSKDALPHTFLDKLEKTFHFSKRNSEIKMRWFTLCIKAEYEKAFSDVVKFLTEQGRMKFVRPLYSQLAKSKKGAKLAVDTFKENMNIYHNIAKKMIKSDLSLE